MTGLVRDLLLGFVVVTALGRFTGIVVMKLRRQGRYARRAVAYPRTWRDRCTIPEPYLLGATTLALALRHAWGEAPGAADWARAGVGALLAGLAVVLMLWTLRVFPGVSTGHYVLPGQRVVADGPYGLVRHPLYLAAFLIWIALGAAFSSPLVLVVTAVYVIPGYWIYMRSEEAMLLDHLGDDYRRYREKVGMLLPRRGRAVPRAPSREPGASS